MRRLIVQEIAKAKGFSMAGLQRAAHLDRNTVQRVWRNALYDARPATLEKIAKALNVLPEELSIIENGEENEAQTKVSHPSPSQPELSSDLPPSDRFAPVLTGEEATHQVRLLKALAEPTRLQILSQLSRYERQVNVTDLASAYRLTQPTISTHLRLLQLVGLVSSYKDEQWIYYYLNRDAIREVAEFLMHTLLGSESSEMEVPS